MKKSESNEAPNKSEKSSSSSKTEPPPSTSTKSDKKKKERVTPAFGRTRGPHPQSPSGEDILKMVSKFPREGYLSKNPTGYIFLDVDDDWIFSVQEEMEEFGYEVPPYFAGPQAVGAHITVVPTNLAKKYKGMVEVGKKVKFEVVRAGPEFPIRYWYGIEAVYKIWVTSEELSQISKEIAGNRYRPPGGFNIVVGVRSIKRRDWMIKNKEIKKEETKEGSE